MEQAEDYGDIQDLVDEAEVIGESPPAEDVEEGTEEVEGAACVELLCGQSKNTHQEGKDAEDLEQFSEDSDLLVRRLYIRNAIKRRCYMR